MPRFASEVSLGFSVMELPNYIYRSERVGKNGKLFSAYKIKTLKDGTDKTSSFVQEDQYLKYGKFLRKTKLDECMQVVNILRGEMNIVGIRPENKETIYLIPKDIRKILLSRKPGLTSLSSIYFYDEEKLLKGPNASEIYYERIKPMKILLDVFYINNRDIFLDLWIIWRTALLVIKSFFK